MSYPIFNVPHKALRYIFGQLIQQAGVLNPGDPEAMSAFVQLFDDARKLVYSHSHHEDEIMFTDLDTVAAGATDHDRSEHIRLHAELDRMDASIRHLAKLAEKGMTNSADVDMLYNQLSRLHSDMLVHMLEEEIVTQPVFWKAMSEQELAGFEPRILAAMSAEETALWMKYIFLSHPTNEVALMLEGIRAESPTEVYRSLLDIARTALSAEAFDKVIHQHDLAS